MSQSSKSKPHPPPPPAGDEAQHQPIAMEELPLSEVNPNVARMQYAIRGPIYFRALELEEQLKSGVKTLPFDEVIRANNCDQQAMGQRPLTFTRQVLAGCLQPDLACADPNLPSDVKDRVRLLMSQCYSRSVGSSTNTLGIELIRRHVAEFIEARDGVPCDWHNVILTAGANEATRLVMELVNTGGGGGSNGDGRPTGVMVAVPQYPIFSTLITELGMHQIPYYLDEDHEWALDVRELERALKEAKGVCKPKMIVVISPGNPTGSVLTRQNIAEIIYFARANRLMILADEVYQQNIWKDGARFYSFKQVMHELGVKVPLVSLMSLSKGYMGECGLRGGYMEVVNFRPEVMKVFATKLTIRMCSVLGQCAIDCLVKPPTAGQPSYDLFVKERDQVLSSMKARAALTIRTLNSLPGLSSNQMAGAMFAFPRIDMPPKAVAAAKALGQEADHFYVSALLEQTGICVVAGSGFGQRPGTYHFRTTILPPPDMFARMMHKFKRFHLDFLKKYQ